MNRFKIKTQIILVAFLVAAILLVANYFSFRHFIRFDLTRNKEFTLADSTKKVLQSLDDPIRLKLYMTKEVPPYLQNIEADIVNMLQEYRLHSKGKLSLDIIVPEDSPQNEQEAMVAGVPPLQLNVVEQDKAEVRKIYLGLVLFYEDKKEVLPVINNLGNLEYDLTSLLMKLTTQQIPKMGVVSDMVSTQGSFNILKQVLAKQIETIPYAFESLDLKNQVLDGLLVLDPRNVTENLTKQWDILLEKGVPVVLLVSKIDVAPDLSTTRITTGLESWLAEKGVILSPNLIIDPKNPARAAFNSGLMQYSIPYPFFIRVSKEGLNRENPMTAQLEELVFPWSTSLSFDSNKNTGWKPTVLAQSSQDSFEQEGDPNVSPQIFESLEIQAGKPHTLALLLEKEKEGQKPSRLIVVANNQFMRDPLLEEFQHNLLFIQNLVDWITWGDALIGIRSRSATVRPLVELNTEAKSFLRYGHVVGIPLLVIFLGLFIRWRRRKKHEAVAEEFLV